LDKSGKLPYGLERFCWIDSDILLSESTLIFLPKKVVDRSEMHISWASHDPEVIKLFNDICSSFSDNPWMDEEQSPLGDVFMLNKRKDGIFLDSINEVGREMVPTNYTEEVRKKMEIIKSELCSDQPIGRISILKGPSRSGKSNLVRDLIFHCKQCVFVYAHVGLINSLDNYDLLTSLIEFKNEQNRKIVLIIEDGDELLVGRMRDNINLISRLLNTADGIYSDLLDMRFVITTNAKSDDIDIAIKERLSAMIHVGELPTKEANLALQAILGNPNDKGLHDVFTKSTLLGHVYKKARELGWKPPPSQATKTTEVFLTSRARKLKTSRKAYRVG